MIFLTFFHRIEENSTKLCTRACVIQILFVILSSNYAYSVAMDEMIRHTGVVISTDGKTAHIRIVQSSACTACKAKSMCVSSESQVKEMDALMLEPMQPGDNVEVEVREHLAWRAVLLAYIMPFIVMMAVIAVLNFTTQWSEAVVGTLSLCAIALYYIGLSVFRHRLQKQFSFTARKL